ncbi:MAG TPA: hypothetical protein VF903_01610 [Nitrospirota bacterium]
MMLVYLLFALTVSTILTALFSARNPQNGKGGAFIGFFVALMLLAWAANAWLLPRLAAGLKISWLPVLALIIFGAVFAASATLSVRPLRPMKMATAGRNNRLDAEAAVFDLFLWFGLLIAGIAVLKSAGI